MTLHWKHHFVTGKADGPDSTEVKPSDWNADHDASTDQAGIVVGRDTSGPGVLQELPLAYSLVGGIGQWAMSIVGAFLPASGTSAQRPTPATAGQIRWNTDLGVMEVYDGANWQPVQTGVTVQTGMVVGWYSNTLPVGGWLFLNGDTLGSSSSGANHAGSGYQALYDHVWDNVPSSRPATGSTGTSAGDWAANLPVTLPDERGYGTAGANNMGGKATNGSLTTANAGVDGETIGAKGGAPGHSLALANIPNHTHDGDGKRGGYNASIGGAGGGSSLWDAGPITIGNVTGYPAGGQTPLITQNQTIIRNSVIKI